MIKQLLCNYMARKYDLIFKSTSVYCSMFGALVLARAYIMEAEQPKDFNKTGAIEVLNKVIAEAENDTTNRKN